MPKTKADADRPLYEYQRQLKAPKVMVEKYPNIAKAIDPYILDRNDEANYNKLGQNTSPTDNSPFNWYRDNEEKASSAIAKDIYNTMDPLLLANRIAIAKGLKFKTAEITPEEAKLKHLAGAYNPNKDELKLKSDDSLPTKIDTVIHESGHAEDWQHPDKAKFLGLEEPTTYPSIDEDFKNKDLYNLSKHISDNHFIASGSHSINELLNQTKSGMAKEGIYPEPDDNIAYDSLNYIKPTIKQLEGYNPPEINQSVFAKTRQLLNK